MCRRIFLFGVVAVVVVGCRSAKIPSDKEPRTVKVTTVHTVDYVDRDFAGMATADDAVNLAFKISGQVASVDVSKGDYVNKGEMLAQLDPRDVELQVAADKAQYERAESQFERMRRLLSHEAVSQQEFEAAQTAYVQARSTYENSKDLLAETKLRAPFAGVIERTYVDTYQRITSGQTILRLVNPVSTTVEFTMPERSMALLSDSLTRFFVTFDNYPNTLFSARLDTYAKTASDASGFPVSLKLNREQSAPYKISPGMTCQITIRSADSTSSEVAIPLTAVYAPAQGGTYAWVVEDGRVRQQRIVLGDIFGRDMVSVQQGLTQGEVVVTAGVYRLQDGERVKIINR
ncbi:MAG: efflux RND transporter periplasmic adaptor subunit [Rikenellaceae bacterium]|nr:efflux RND transporter periplasmic adaptor subunit [Rikenellaceae bacterium]